MENEREGGNKKMLAVPLATFSGCFFAIAATFGKIVASGIGGLTLISLKSWLPLLTSLAFWMMIISVMLGSILWVWALREGRVSIVGPIQSGIMIIASVIIGIIYFDELITLQKIGAILIVTVGGMILSRKS